MQIKYSYLLLCASMAIIVSCGKEKSLSTVDIQNEDDISLLQQASRSVKMLEHDYKTQIPDYLKNMGMTNHDVDNQKVALGRILFYDKNLSSDRTISCASCHKQNMAFSDDAQFSRGVGGELSERQSMSLANVVSFSSHYSAVDGKETPALLWDGRALDVKSQAQLAFTNPHEMNMTMDAIVTRVQEMPYYAYFLKEAYGDLTVTKERIVESLQEFVGAIGCANTKFDLAMERVNGDINQTSETFNAIVSAYDGTKDTVLTFTPPLLNFNTQEMLGKNVFIANCSKCHSPIRPLQEHFMACNGLDEIYSDKGLGKITGNSSDDGVFKSPSLRNIAYTAPYMHDGRFKTLEEVVNFYSDGVKTTSALHPLMKRNGKPGFALTTAEKTNLIAFLKTFSDPSIKLDERFSNPFLP